MFKKLPVLLFAIFLITNTVWAGGSRDKNESRTAQDSTNFNDSFDLSDRKTGKWNFYVESTDRAGNVTRVGPENIYYDPETDLPRVTIVNPIQNMRVQGNLNIVGIAADDDGVAHVEIVVTRGRDGRGEELVRTRARGTDYWSFMLDTTNPEIWKDGTYTITAWAVDSRGLSGDLSNASDYGYSFRPRQTKIHQVYWQLDRKKPDIQITSHEVGELVSGRVRLRGTVYDGNGISSFAYSLNEGQSYTNVRVSEDRRTGLYPWDIDINTNIFDDGPAVIWFRSLDNLGSVGVTAHLLFANNKGPEVKIVYPEADAVVSGVFSIAGSASHPVGLKSLTWRAGRLSGEIELLPGNHWWSQTIDLRGSRDSNIDIEIRAEDVSGNVTTARQRYRVNPNADIPTVTLTAPANGTALAEGNNIFIKGTAADNNGIASIFYSHNGREAVEIPATTGDFSFAILGVNEGSHTVEVWAKDVNGITGPRASVRGLTTIGTAPQPFIASITAGAGSVQARPFYSGMQVRLEPRGRANMEIAIRAQALTNTTVQIGNLDPVVVRPTAGRENTLRATVPIPLNLPSGFTKIEIKTTDRHGREVTYPDYVFIEQLDPMLQTEAPVAARWFEWVRPQEAAGRIVLNSPDEILVGLSNIPMETAVLRGTGADALSLEVDQYGRVLLKANREGVFGPLNVVSGALTSRAFIIAADFNGPVITVRDPPAGRFVQRNVSARFTIASPTRITQVQGSVDMGETWQTIPAAADITHNFNIASAEDGLVTILIRVTNESGKSSIGQFSVLKDTAVPAAALVMPIEESRVNGTTRIGFDIQEAGRLRSVTYTRGGVSRVVFNVDRWENDFVPNFLEVLMDSTQMPLARDMAFTFEDMAGNRTVINQWPFVIDQQMDIPIVHIVLPMDNEVITADFIASGVMFDDDGIKNIQFRLNQGAWRVLDAQYGFSIPIALSSLTDNINTISVFAEDIYGVRSQPVTRSFRVSLAEPVAELQYPAFDTVVRDSVELRGRASDGNGIKEVLISVDNGNTFNKAAGTTAWTYRFNTRILKDGAHVVFIKVIDNYDVSATYASMINIDNTPPEVTVDSPFDGFISTGSISVLGRVYDPNILTITLDIRSLTGQAVRSDLRNRRLEVREIIREVLDLQGLADGLYNVEILANDKAGNVTRVSRNFQLARQSITNFVEILYPLDNEIVSGDFYIYGFAGGVSDAGTVTLRVNNVDRATVEVDSTGYWKFQVNSEMFPQENNQVIVHSNFGGGNQVRSRTQNLFYNQSGPWVTIDSFNFGEYAYNRPYLYGRTGYILSEEDREKLADRGTSREERDAIQNKIPQITEISFDNGRTFTRTGRGSGRDQDYRYRLETGEMPEGMHYILVRTTMRNGEVAISRMIVQVDKTPPVVRLISPEAGGRYNEMIAFSATASDDVELISTTYHLRAGDKSMYGLPGFLQGLYIEGTIPPFLRYLFNELPTVPFGGGVAFFDFGLGLSFFDDNVKVQLNYSFMSEDIWRGMGGNPVGYRYGGHIFGLKLLAGLYTLPFGPLLGPDWEWLSASFAIGANFSMFTETQSGSPTIMSALLLQIEFPKVTLPNRKYLRTFSFFTEGQLWFVPTDVDSEAFGLETVLPKVVVGLRLYIF